MIIKDFLQNLKSPISLQVKFIVLLFSELIFLGLATAIFLVYEYRNISNILTEKASERAMNIQNIIELKSASLKSFVIDYSFYDDMVLFVQKQDKKFEQEVLLPAAATFDLDMIWIFNHNHDLRYFKGFGDFPPDLKTLFSGRRLLFTSFKEKPVQHFFLQAHDNLILEIYGATIHPSDDYQRTTKPIGYLLAARAWDGKHLMLMSQLSNSYINLDKYAGQEFKAFYNSKKSVFSFTEILYGWDNNPEVVLIAETESPEVERFMSIFKAGAVFFVLCSLVLFISSTFFILFLVVKPINIIKNALMHEKAERLDNIDSKQREFYSISLLIKRFFAHLDMLFKEIDMHLETQQKLKKFEMIFKSSFYPSFLHSGNGKMLACSDPAIALFKYDKNALLSMNISDIFPDYFSSAKSLEYYTADSPIAEFSEISFRILKGKRKDGTLFSAEVQVRKYQLENSVFFYCIIREVL